MNKLFLLFFFNLFYFGKTQEGSNHWILLQPVITFSSQDSSSVEYLCQWIIAIRLKCTRRRKVIKCGIKPCDPHSANKTFCVEYISFGCLIFKVSLHNSLLEVDATLYPCAVLCYISSLCFEVDCLATTVMLFLFRL